MAEETRPRGRRPAGSDARGAIVVAARAEFAERGYEAASMRSVARRAGVDPALVRHYFPDRGELFAVSVLPAAADPSEVAERVVAGGLPGLGGRLVTEVLTVWADDGGAGFRAAVGLMAGNVERPQALVAYLGRTVFERIGRLLAPDEAALRIGLLASQVAGLLMMRYVVRLEPAASMPVDELAALVGPTIDRYLTAPLPSSLASVPFPPTPVPSSPTPVPSSPIPDPSAQLPLDAPSPAAVPSPPTPDPSAQLPLDAPSSAAVPSSRS